MPDKYDCIDCGEFTDGYMIDNKLWISIIDNTFDCLCLACLDERMNRKLSLADFQTDKKINRAVFVGALLARREDATNAPR